MFSVRHGGCTNPTSGPSAYAPHSLKSDPFEYCISGCGKFKLFILMFLKEEEFSIESFYFKN